jgi:arylformamidase
MKILDISMTIEPGMTVYKDKPEKQPLFERTRSIDSGVEEHKITLDSHVGTHIDAPAHMIKGGTDIDRLDLARFFGKCRVLNMITLHKISRMDLEVRNIQKGERILVKTKNSDDKKWNPEFVQFTKDAAQKEITLIGTDGLGIEMNNPNHEVHTTLLEKGIPVLEGLRLSDVNPGEYFLCAIPLKLKGIDGSPVRAILLPLEDAQFLFG